MSEISTTELFGLYLDTIARSTTKVLQLTDEEIAYNLFEEFDAGAHSFLHVDNLNKLCDAGLIDDESLAISKKVRTTWMELQRRPSSIEDVKTTKQWRELLDLCDRLASRLGIEEQRGGI